MPDFVPHAIDPGAVRAEVAELGALLQSNAHLKEAVFRDFFRSRPHAAARATALRFPWVFGVFY